MDARIGRLAAGCAAAVAAAMLAPPAVHAVHAVQSVAPVRCHGQVATIVGTPGRDRLTGTPGDDVIWAGGGHDSVDGRGGADVVCGGTGADLVTDGRGLDVVDLGEGDDTVQPAPHGADTFRGGPGHDQVDYQLVGFDGPGVQVDLATGTTGGVAGADGMAGFGTWPGRTA